VTINNNKFSGSVVNNTNDKWTVTAKAEYISNKLDPKNEDVNEVEASSGTAFFVTDQGHLITNNHVVEGCKDKSKIVYKNQEYPAKLIAKDKNLDFALLKADLSKNRFIELSENPPKKLQKIIAAGYPLGKFLSDDLKFTSGIVSSLKGYNDDSTLIQIDAALNPGNSGGPIVDENNGKLVAVAVAGLRKDKTEAVNFGIKSNSLRNFLNANQMKLQSKQLFSFGKNIDVSQILEESTVYTFCK
jgi:S1-C subfamily serine protease